jgi:hypothetical protein
LHIPAYNLAIEPPNLVLKDVTQTGTALHVMSRQPRTKSRGKRIYGRTLQTCMKDTGLSTMIMISFLMISLDLGMTVTLPKTSQSCVRGPDHPAWVRWDERYKCWTGDVNEVAVVQTTKALMSRFHCTSSITLIHLLYVSNSLLFSSSISSLTFPEIFGNPGSRTIS